jgi:hypothetical protein
MTIIKFTVMALTVGMAQGAYASHNTMFTQGPLTCQQAKMKVLAVQNALPAFSHKLSALSAQTTEAALSQKLQAWDKEAQALHASATSEVAVLHELQAHTQAIRTDLCQQARLFASHKDIMGAAAATPVAPKISDATEVSQLEGAGQQAKDAFARLNAVSIKARALNQAAVSARIALEGVIGRDTLLHKLGVFNADLAQVPQTCGESLLNKAKTLQLELAKLKTQTTALLAAFGKTDTLENSRLIQLQQDAEGVTLLPDASRPAMAAIQSEKAKAQACDRTLNSQHIPAAIRGRFSTYARARAVCHLSQADAAFNKMPAGEHKTQLAGDFALERATLKLMSEAKALSAKHEYPQAIVKLEAASAVTSIPACKLAVSSRIRDLQKRQTTADTGRLEAAIHTCHFDHAYAMLTSLPSTQMQLKYKRDITEAISRETQAKTQLQDVPVLYAESQYHAVLDKLKAARKITKCPGFFASINTAEHTVKDKMVGEGHAVKAKAVMVTTDVKATTGQVVTHKSPEQNTAKLLKTHKSEVKPDCAKVLEGGHVQFANNHYICACPAGEHENLNWMRCVK